VKQLRTRNILNIIINALPARFLIPYRMTYKDIIQDQLQARPSTTTVHLRRTYDQKRLTASAVASNLIIFMRRAGEAFLKSPDTSNVRRSTRCTRIYVSQILQKRENILERNWSHFLSPPNKIHQWKYQPHKVVGFRRRTKPYTILFITLGRVIRTPPNFVWCL
jgi:hypothetical protein